jgi:hypothetical protein
MKSLLTAVSVILLSFAPFTAAARQGELPLEHPDQVLQKAYPGEANTKLIQFEAIKSAKVRETLNSVDLPLEMGDGYYGIIKSALYMVFTKDGQVAGFMEAALLSYTEDPELFLAAAFVNPQGRRLGEVHDLNIYSGYDDSELKNLPVELQPEGEEK